LIGEIVVEPMTQSFIVWRCLHGGPLSCGNIDQWAPGDKMPWARYRLRNVALLSKLTEVYGACAIVAREEDEIVGLLRFYPKAVWQMDGAGLLCLQQDHPAGPVDDLAEREFPALTELEDRTLEVHCLMAGAPSESGRQYKRRGIATRMAKELIRWAQGRGWESIEASSFEDIPILYRWTGNAGHTFWKKLGFHVADRFPNPHLQERNEFVVQIEEQAKTLGLEPARAKDRIVMRLGLTQ
jgi:GNAT superfamily N-acetyltransferase